MADTTITALDTASGIDATQDWLAIDRTSLVATQKINRNTYLGITSTPLGTTDSQSPTNKTFDNTNIFTVRDDRLTLQDNSDTTKQAQFQLSGITTGTTRTYTLPDASSTLADIATSQTFTNKTLTSPTITGGTISNSTISVDSIAEFTSANGVTVDGMNIKDGKLNTNNSVVASNITDGDVTGSKLSTSAIKLGYAEITSTFTTASVNSYVDVTGLSSTVSVPTGGRDVKITVDVSGFFTTAAAATALTLAIREGSTLIRQCIINQAVASYSDPRCLVARISAPSSGSHTYKVSVAQNAAGTINVGAGNGSTTTTFSASFILVEAI